MIWFHSESDGTWWLKGIESGCKWEWPSSPLHLYWCPIWLWIEGGNLKLPSLVTAGEKTVETEEQFLPESTGHLWGSLLATPVISLCPTCQVNHHGWPFLWSLFYQNLYIFSLKRKQGAILLELALFTILWTAFHVSLYRSAYFLKVEAFSLLWLSII